MTRGLLFEIGVEELPGGYVSGALMQLERTIREIGEKFGLAPEDLNLDLGPLGNLM